MTIERPRENDVALLRIAAEKLAAALTRFDADTFPADAQDVVDDLVAAFINEPHADGYLLGKYLDDHGWSCDFEIAEILNSAWVHIQDAHCAAVAAWVTEHGITPRFAKGDRVIGFTNRFGHRVQCSYIYTVRGIDQLLARYTLACPELGHMTDEQYANQGTGTIGAYFNFEDVEAAP